MDMKEKILKAMEMAKIEEGDFIIGLDSLDMVELLMALEEEFDISIDEDDLLFKEFNNINDLIKYMKGVLDGTDKTS